MEIYSLYTILGLFIATTTAANLTDIESAQNETTDEEPAISASTAINALRSELMKLRRKVSTNEGKISTNTAKISTNTGKISTNTGKISTNTGKISTNTGKISTNTGKISTHTGQISSNSGSIRSNSGRISSNSGSINTNAGNINAKLNKASFNTGGIRLVDSFGNINYRGGRLEIRRNNVWGTVCDDGSGEGNTQADHHIGEVVCHMLGFRRADGYTTNKSFYGNVNVPEKTWLDNVKCTGNEETIYECAHKGWGEEDCNHNEDVGVYCN